MSVKLTESQMTTLKGMATIAEAIADQLLHIMRNSGLDNVGGSCITISVNPNLTFCTESIYFGSTDSDAGFVLLAKGAYDDHFLPTGRFNSKEYELLFADDAVRERMQQIVHPEKPLPPDGLWVSDNRFSPPVDCGVSVGDSLAE